MQVCDHSRSPYLTVMNVRIFLRTPNQISNSLPPQGTRMTDSFNSVIATSSLVFVFPHTHTHTIRREFYLSIVLFSIKILRHHQRYKHPPQIAVRQEILFSFNIYIFYSIDFRDIVSQFTVNEDWSLWPIILQHNSIE